MILNESRKDSPSSPEEEVEKEEIDIEKLTFMKECFKNINKICEILKEKNLELSKNIKNYQNGKMYIDQEEQLKNLKEDNKVLRNKSIKLNINERELRNKIKDLSLDKNITVQESNKLKILITNFENKVKFYSEENAKINVEKHEAMKKLKNSLTQLNELEQDKIKIKNAVGNLNNLLSNSNVDTQTFKKKIKNFSKINKEIEKKILKNSKNLACYPIFEYIYIFIYIFRIRHNTINVKYLAWLKFNQNFIFYIFYIYLEPFFSKRLNNRKLFCF